MELEFDLIDQIERIRKNDRYSDFEKKFREVYLLMCNESMDIPDREYCLFQEIDGFLNNPDKYLEELSIATGKMYFDMMNGEVQHRREIITNTLMISRTSPKKPKRESVVEAQKENVIKLKKEKL